MLLDNFNSQFQQQIVQIFEEILSDVHALKISQVEFRHESDYIGVSLVHDGRLVRGLKLGLDWWSRIEDWVLFHSCSWGQVGSRLSNKSFSLESVMSVGTRVASFKSEIKNQQAGLSSIQLSSFKWERTPFFLLRASKTNTELEYYLKLLGVRSGVLIVSAPTDALLEQALGKVFSFANVLYLGDLNREVETANLIELAKSRLVVLGQTSADIAMVLLNLRQSAVADVLQKLNIKGIYAECRTANYEVVQNYLELTQELRPLIARGAKSMLLGFLSKVGYVPFQLMSGVEYAPDTKLKIGLPDEILSSFTRKSESETVQGVVDDQQLVEPSSEAAASVTVESELGKGSPKQSKGSILIVEDDHDQQEILSLIFRSAGYDIEVAEDGREALAAMRFKQPDLILTDLMMPNMDGEELVLAVRSSPKLAHIPILILSVVADADRQAELLKQGANQYVTKNINRKALLERVEDLLEPR